MADEDGSPHWWRTLPGILTGVAAVISALAALAAALHQSGWLEGRSAAASDAAGHATQGGPAEPADSAGQPAQAVPAARAVALPVQREYRLDTVAFTLLAATLSPRNAEQDTLSLRLRMHNRDRFPQPFWDRDFRLLVDSRPLPPAEPLGELVEGEAAKDGELLFLLPRDTAAAVLRIHRGQDSTDIGLDFTKAAG